MSAHKGVQPRKPRGREPRRARGEVAVLYPFPSLRAAARAGNTPGQLLARDCSRDLILHATLVVADAMDAERMSETELAKRTGVSRQMVNQNFGAGIRTLKTLATFADALGYDASVVLRKRESAEETVGS